MFGSEYFSFTDFMKSDDSESQAISEAILSSAKCRVMASKKIISSINNAYFEGRGGQNYSVAVFVFALQDTNRFLKLFFNFTKSLNSFADRDIIFI